MKPRLSTHWFEALVLLACCMLPFAGRSAAPPVIVRQSHSLNLRAGAQVTLSVEATGNSPLTYQWYWDQNEDNPLEPPQGPNPPIRGATNATLGLGTVGARIGSAVSYWCVVSDAASQTVVSRPARITVYPKKGPYVVRHPKDQFAIYGTPISLEVDAVGAAPIAYQWFRNNVPILGSTNRILDIEPESIPCCRDYSDYYVTISDGIHTNRSSRAYVNLAEGLAPVVSRSPTSLRVPRGDAASFTVSAFGPGPLTYRWYRNGVWVPWGFGPVLTIPEVGGIDVGIYEVLVSNRYGDARSTPARLDLVPEVSGPPVLTKRPTDLMFSLGDVIALDVEAAGAPPLVYQWFKDGHPLPSANSPHLEWSKETAPHQTGAYHVTIRNELGEVTSPPVTVTLRPSNPPAFVESPLSQDVPQFATLILVAQASGTGSLIYEFLEMDAHSGSTVTHSLGKDTRGLFEFQTGPPGTSNTLHVAVTDLLGRRALSQVFTLTATGPEHPSPPLIIRDLSSVRVVAGDSATLGLAVRGAEPYRFLWWKDGTNLWETSTPELVLPHVDRSAAGQYWVTVFDRFRVASDSEMVLLEVEIPPHPVILQHPPDLLVSSDGTAVFSVLADGNPSPSFQWYRQGHPIAGATAQEFVIEHVTPADMGEYWVVVANGNGTVRSRTAHLNLPGRPRYAFPLASTELVAGHSGSAGDEVGTPTQSRFNSPTGLAFSPEDVLVIADSANHRLKVLTPQGSIRPAAGSGRPGLLDGPAGQSRFQDPTGLAVGDRGHVYLADTSNHAVRRLSVDGQISTLVGRGTSGTNDGPVQSALLDHPLHLAVDASGTLWLTEAGHHGIRRISPEGDVVLWAGSRNPGFRDGPRTEARFQGPTGLAVGAAGELFVAEAGGHRIRRIDREGIVSTLGGSGTPGYQDGNQAVSQFRGPTGIALDSEGALLIADTGNHVLRRLSPSGLVETVAGTGNQGSADGPVTTATFSSPTGVAAASDGSIIVSDTGNHTLRRITQARTPGIRLAVEFATKSRNLTLSWPSGILQTAPTALGPWDDAPAATSPQTLPVTQQQRFFRIRSP